MFLVWWGLRLALWQDAPLLGEDFLGSLDGSLNLGEEVVVMIDAGIGPQLRRGKIHGRVALAVAGRPILVFLDT